MNVTNDVTKKLTERQRLIYELQPFGITKDDTKNEPITIARLAKQFGKSFSTIQRDMKAFQDLDLVRRPHLHFECDVGPFICKHGGQVALLGLFV